MYVEIVFNIPLNKTLTYKKPDEITNSLVGCRVIAPIRGRGVKGVVVAETSTLNGNYTPLLIQKRIDLEPICGEAEFKLASWISDYYHTSFGEALFASLPAGTPSKKDKKVSPIKIKQKPYLTLNDEQEYALNEIITGIDQKENNTFLIHGVTGSGKTEVYMRAIKHVIEMGKEAIVILPEISLTPQTIKRFAERFEGHIAILHSKLSPNQKYRYWQMIRKGEIQIIVGARSAIFSPTPNLGIIVVDEEHETSYKSSESPRYNARQIAFYRAERERATLILGSATPSVETYYHAKNNNKIKLLSLNKRASNINMPYVNIIDMKKAKRSNMFSMMSEDLVAAMNTTLDKKEQIILLLNRKGYSNYVSCSHCNRVLECPHCSVSLTYHKSRDIVMCHYCGYTQHTEERCSECNIGTLKKLGVGTERVEENLKLIFPNANIYRVDQESVKTVGSYETIFDDFKNQKIDILIGTQMIAKGLDFPNVTLVGVLLADTSLHIPDFRSAERTFSLLTQVAGRSGRGDKKGAVYIQTYSPTHYALEYSRNHDYKSFYDDEIIKRREKLYPPFSRLVRIVVRGIDEEIVKSDTYKILDLLEVSTASLGEGIEIVGTAPCVMSKLKKYYRWNILIKTKNQSLLKDFFSELKKSFIAQKNNYVEIDIDPINMT